MKENKMLICINLFIRHFVITFKYTIAGSTHILISSDFFKKVNIRNNKKRT